MNTIYYQSLFDEIISLQASIARANDYAAGVLLDDLRKLLAEYATADMIILRCPCDTTPFWLTISQTTPASFYCQKCQQPFDRLLASGTWQSEVERQQENLAALNKVSG